VRRVKIADEQTTFWRYHAHSETCLSTAECVFHLLRQREVQCFDGHHLVLFAVTVLSVNARFLQCSYSLPPPPPSRTKWTRLVHPSVLIGHVSSKRGDGRPGRAPRVGARRRRGRDERPVEAPAATGVALPAAPRAPVDARAPSNNTWFRAISASAIDAKIQKKPL